MSDLAGYVRLVRNSKIFPTTLNRQHAAWELVKVLADEKLLVSSLIYSVSTEGFIHVTGYCYNDEWWGMFDATWTFDYDKISSPGNQYELTDVEIYDYD